MAGRACCYVRVSTTDKQDTSRQSADLKDLAEKHGYTLTDADVFAEHISGFSAGESRPVFSKMMKKLEAGEYQMLYIHEVSRLSRDPMDGQTKLLELAKMKIPVYVKAINMSSLDEDGNLNQIFNLFFTLLIHFAKSEAEYFSERVRSSMRLKIKHGHAGVGIMLPFGYKRDSNKMLAIDEEESQYVKLIYQSVLNGMGAKQIAHLLNEKGVKTRLQKDSKSGKLKMKNRNLTKSAEDIKWVDGTVHGILKNPIYKGERTYKTYSKKNRVDKVESDVEFSTFSAPVIIQPEIWEEVQTVMAQKARTSGYDKRWHYLLKGLVICSKCGRNYYGRYKADGSDQYYICSSTREKACGNCGINIEAIESTVFEFIKRDFKLHTYLKNRQSNIGSEKELAKYRVDADIKRKQIDDYNAEIDVLNDIYRKSKGRMSAREYDDELVKIETSITRLENELMELSKKIVVMQDISRELNSIDSLTKQADLIYKDRNLMHQVLVDLVDKIVVTAVNENRNNNKYILSIFFKGSDESETVYLRMKARHVSEEAYVGKKNVEDKGQGRFKYMWLTSTPFKFDDSGIIRTPKEELVNTLSEWEFNEDLFKVPRLIPFNEGDNATRTETPKKRAKKKAA